MGYATCIGTCIGCGKTFSFNPVHVPSVRDSNGNKQPICQDCVDKANPIRIQNGLEPIVPLPDAYTYCDENEME